MLKTLTAAALGVASVYVSLAKDIRILPDCSSDPLASNGVCNTTYSPAERASALVAALNTEEKLANLVRSVYRATLAAIKVRRANLVL